MKTLLSNTKMLRGNINHKINAKACLCIHSERKDKNTCILLIYNTHRIN